MNKEEYLLKKGFIVTEEGKFLNPKGKEITSLNDNGYIRVTLRYQNKNIICKAHRLQAYQKYGDSLYTDGIIVRHFNGIKTDNSWDNILIGTVKQNQLDIPEQIRIKRSRYAASFNIKYDKKEVIEYYNSCKSYKKTMEKFNIKSKGTLHYIINKRLV